MLRPALAVLLFFCTILTPPPAGAWTRDRVLVVIDNRSSNAGAGKEVTPVVKSLLAQKGYEVVDPEAALALPIDRSGGAPLPALRDAAQKARVDVVVTLSIGFLLDPHDRPRGPEANPAIGMLARMYAPDARILWRNSLAMILDEPMVRSPAKTAYVSRRRRVALSDSESAYKSPTTVVCEQLLWTLPRARPSPEELAARAAPPPTVPAEPVKATRFEAPPERIRDFGDAAHFPLLLGRPQHDGDAARRKQ